MNSKVFRLEVSDNQMCIEIDNGTHGIRRIRRISRYRSGRQVGDGMNGKQDCPSTYFAIDVVASV
jgi:hypothetical protein